MHCLVVPWPPLLLVVLTFSLVACGGGSDSGGSKTADQQQSAQGADGAAGLAGASGEPDLVLLDLGLPDMDGLAVCRRLRARSAIPIIMITARGEEADRVVGLELGADDCVAKPFGVRELVARIRAVARRTVGHLAWRWTPRYPPRCLRRPWPEPVRSGWGAGDRPAHPGSPPRRM
ncbi:hypothetical protein GCM10009574_095620 [Streptomyces asiaticus]|uniref:Response regulatory domain-containing protein n=2 Tax=Streptomyces rhizosphaericus TaxID=114699 RepID=A0ABP4BXK6_9ACTN